MLLEDLEPPMKLVCPWRGTQRPGTAAEEGEIFTSNELGSRKLPPSSHQLHGSVWYMEGPAYGPDVQLKSLMDLLGSGWPKTPRRSFPNAPKFPPRAVHGRNGAILGYWIYQPSSHSGQPIIKLCA